MKYWIFEEQGDYHRFEVLVGSTDDADFAMFLKDRGFVVRDTSKVPTNFDSSIDLKKAREAYRHNVDIEAEKLKLRARLKELENSEKS